MNEVAGLERDSAREGAKGSASANDLAVFEAGEIDSLGKLCIGTQFLERAGLERRTKGSRKEQSAKRFARRASQDIESAGKLQNEAES
jgi:hypothetical protein